MNIWLIKDAENLPCDGKNPRLARMGLVAYILADMGHKVTWWSTTFNHFQKKYRDINKRNIQLDNGIEIKLLHAKAYKKNVSMKRLFYNASIATQFYKHAEKMKDKPDIIVVAMPTISLTVKAVAFGRKFNIPVVVDVRDLNPEMFPDAFEGILKKAVKVGIIPLQYALRHAMKRATAVIGTTEPYLNYGLKYACRGRKANDKVFFVSYPNSTGAIAQKSIEKWGQYNFESDLVVCFFGQFGSMVDFDTIIETAKLCQKKQRNVTFVLCGTGEKLEYYRKKAKDLNNVVLPGWVDQDDIRALGEVSDIGLMAYRQSKNFELQMPNKFGEYLALGLAVGIQPIGIMEKMAEKYQCGFSYKTAEELFDRLNLLYEDSTLLGKMKKNARKLYEEQFCAEIVYKRYAEHVVSLCNRRGKKEEK